MKYLFKRKKTYSKKREKKHTYNTLKYRCRITEKKTFLINYSHGMESHDRNYCRMHNAINIIISFTCIEYHYNIDVSTGAFSLLLLSLLLFLFDSFVLFLFSFEVIWNLLFRKNSLYHVWNHQTFKVGYTLHIRITYIH